MADLSRQSSRLILKRYLCALVCSQARSISKDLAHRKLVVIRRAFTTCMVPARFAQSFSFLSHKLTPACAQDFCMNGLRIGMLHSKNKSLCDAFNSTALFIKVGSPSDSLFSSLISQPSNLHWFVNTNRTRLAEAYNYAVNWLDTHQIPYQASSAGHFIWSLSFSQRLLGLLRS